MLLMLFQVNQTEMLGKTREDAVLMLLSLQEHVELLVQYKPHGMFVKCLMKMLPGYFFNYERPSCTHIICTTWCALDVNVSHTMWHDQYFNWAYFSKMAISHNITSRVLTRPYVCWHNVYIGQPKKCSRPYSTCRVRKTNAVWRNWW